MRHKVYGKHLGRSKDQRTALFKSLVRSLILEESIKTTQPKAKAIKGLVDKIINQAKSPISKRLVSQFLTQKQVQEKLTKEILPRVKSRSSGYTSLVKLGPRLGDGAMMVKMSLLLDVATKVAKGSKETKVDAKSQSGKEAEVIDAEIVAEPKAKTAKAKVTKEKK